MKINMKMNAFTLAEVLLTLIIVGVISALTVPTLKNHSDEARYVASTQKAMSEVVAAVSNMESVHGDASTWNFSSDSTIEWFRNSMNIVPLSADQSSWDISSLDGTTKTFNPTFVTADGMAWEVSGGGYQCGGGAVIIDLNGPDQPNTIGIDVQGFRIGYLCNDTSKTGDFGIYAMGDGVNDKNSSWACTSYVMKYKKMPWLYEFQKDCSAYMGK